MMLWNVFAALGRLTKYLFAGNLVNCGAQSTCGTSFSAVNVLEGIKGDNTDKKRNHNTDTTQ